MAGPQFWSMLVGTAFALLVFWFRDLHVAAQESEARGNSPCFGLCRCWLSSSASRFCNMATNGTAR